jgi:hypothetical protein
VLVARRGGLSAMVLAMRTHPTALALQEEACRLIANLAENGWGFSRGVWFTLFGLPRVYGRTSHSQVRVCFPPLKHFLFLDSQRSDNRQRGPLSARQAGCAGGPASKPAQHAHRSVRSPSMPRVKYHRSSADACMELGLVPWNELLSKSVSWLPDQRVLCSCSIYLLYCCSPLSLPKLESAQGEAGIHSTTNHPT